MNVFLIDIWYQDPIISKYWLQVERSGVLSMELVDHVFSKFIQQGLVKEDILDMMEKFGLIAKFSPSPDDVKFFVPAQLKSSPEILFEVEPSDHDPCHGLLSLPTVSSLRGWVCPSWTVPTAGFKNHFLVFQDRTRPVPKPVSQWCLVCYREAGNPRFYSDLQEGFYQNCPLNDF